MRVDPSKVELVRFATLAANSHNTQPWKFSIKETQFQLYRITHGGVQLLTRMIITCL